MNVLAVGLDLVEMDRFRLLYGDFDPDVLARCFTTREQAIVGADADCLARLAGRFAAKEAVLKTIGGLQDGIALTDVEIISDGVSPPRAEVTGGALAAAVARGITNWQISLTHGAQSAAAVALAFGTAST
ncbi:4'-phosphopantetheinyl transferase superfamily protein [Azospirillum sp. INR13]|uniref:holo-ACP synthase n=1 Tax=Azospirillum sp. INR13 TaxID=2596919 RepID=UPI001892706B|nr:4'-phosphopantetheinyl transferase superfamily protein [Azospirillum sp. INR13]